MYKIYMLYIYIYMWILWKPKSYSFENENDIFHKNHKKSLRNFWFFFPLPPSHFLTSLTHSLGAFSDIKNNFPLFFPSRCLCINFISFHLLRDIISTHLSVPHVHAKNNIKKYRNSRYIVGVEEERGEESSWRGKGRKKHRRLSLISGLCFCIFTSLCFLSRGRKLHLSSCHLAPTHHSILVQLMTSHAQKVPLRSSNLSATE